MTNPTTPAREPITVPSRDGAAPVEIVPGARVVRRPIFQARYGQKEGWGRELVDRISVAKSLGFKVFEIDISPVKVPEEAKAEDGLTIRYSIFGISAAPVVEGDEWKAKEDAVKKLRDDAVITVYALVVE